MTVLLSPTVLCHFFGVTRARNSPVVRMEGGRNKRRWSVDWPPSSLWALCSVAPCFKFVGFLNEAHGDYRPQPLRPSSRSLPKSQTALRTWTPELHGETVMSGLRCNWRISFATFRVNAIRRSGWTCPRSLDRHVVFGDEHSSSSGLCR